jgi:hypothetical protein
MAFYSFRKWFKKVSILPVQDQTRGKRQEDKVTVVHEPIDIGRF